MIDFKPPYQRRGGLWSREDKQFLIDSILNQYDIPKLYIADFTFGPSPLNIKSKQYAVIDGKQRFESILDFIDGNIVLSKDFTLAMDPSLDLAGLGYRDLRANYPKVASRFDNFNLTVMSVVTDEEGKINELFVRLNRNKTLTGPEIRNAMRGHVPQMIRDLASNEFFKSRIKFASKRGQDLDAAAKMLLVEFRGRLVETKKATLDNLVEEGRNAEADIADSTVQDFERAAGRVRAVLRRMNDIFVPGDPLLGTQGVVVPYYWFIKKSSEENLHLIRTFLVQFEADRAKNREIAKDPDQADRVNHVLSRYDQLNRSINDVGSLEGRVEILNSMFRAWSKGAAA
ncbi:DUF262 domain-containing protein [Paenarthrobacter ilicis]|uniref:DUF262 domain-containing protein n=1 Tax=Paenarthrobacter ilicis TaxID=43665 RepID=UPI00300B5406